MLKIMFKLVVLLCPASTPFEACDQTNAPVISHAAHDYATPFACLSDAQAALPGTLVSAPAKVRIKIMCPREFAVAGGTAH